MSEQENRGTVRVGRRVSTFFVIVFFCFIAGFLGAWVFVSTGIAKLDGLNTITTNREKIVAQEGEIMQSIVKKVSPSVVSVTTQSVNTNYYGDSSVSEGAGTGMIISKDGYVLTNKHVVGNSTQVKIITSEGKVYHNVVVVGSDPLNDIAFLKIKTNDKFAPVTFADSAQVKVGEKVMAIGNALGEFQNSVTSGIISGVGRPIVAQDGQDGEQLDNLFQTDAAINPGNSGGPLFNLTGEVVGMNTAVAQDAQGIGFAIPSNATKGLMKHLFATGKVERAYLGVRYVAITPSVASENKLSVQKGAYILGDQATGAVVAGSPADKAGLREKDIITKVNGVVVDANNGLALHLAQFAPGDTVKLTVISGGATKEVSVTLVAYSANF